MVWHLYSRNYYVAPWRFPFKNLVSSRRSLRDGGNIKFFSHTQIIVFALLDPGIRDSYFPIGPGRGGNRDQALTNQTV